MGEVTGVWCGTDQFQNEKGVPIRVDRALGYVHTAKNLTGHFIQKGSSIFILLVFTRIFKRLKV